LLWELFITFLRIGAVSFGGGYAVIPLIHYEVESHGWLMNLEFQELVSLAGMAPGPIATNSATLIGYKTAGLAGAAMTTLGIILPSLIVVIMLSAIFYRLSRNKWVRSMFYGLRPVITALILYAAIRFGFLDAHDTGFTWGTLCTLGISAGCLIMMIRHKVHPIAVIAAAGAAGIILY